MAKRLGKRFVGNVEAEFSRLFWAARREQNQRGQRATANDPAHKAAVTFGRAQSWLWAEQLLAASSLDRREKHDKALESLESLKASVPARWQGILHFVLGAALGRKGLHDEAIKAYHKALGDPNFDMRGRAWDNLGIALAAKGEHDEAIKAYRKALKDRKYDEPGQALNNLGVSLHAKGEHNKAIKAYRKALTYHKALKDRKYDMPARVWTNLAQAYVDAGKGTEAGSAFLKALASPDPNKGSHKRALLGLQFLNSGIVPDAMSPDDRAMAATPTGTETAVEFEGRESSPPLKRRATRNTKSILLTRRTLSGMTL